MDRDGGTAQRGGLQDEWSAVQNDPVRGSADWLSGRDVTEKGASPWREGGGK